MSDIQTNQTPSSNQTLGILGGLGPMASAYFYELLTAHTDAPVSYTHLDVYKRQVGDAGSSFNEFDAVWL